ncbi:MAG: [acyl-carrier-protein] S-malonyltransferase [Alphaproteobacteria bacterium RIFCSPLOWO2_01_FULL_40_26]|nr:MAG: [acyl-carrier-protein] S-malonyltransferase [Alphaproteobacteria bacterium RIFCSPHIGHO2_02_FULL_40_34]OFW95141.1 MAG: [acyl-carrier-protein] S-malonyltransferase [Alphaproteobacteria bacterium RIFCSPLOWO2_01_FULL_40_26]OFX09135.1 MAG: [acyl-carrier-protein] S-malonyltransferase [Alphaproteobacteria bacterium RIFCSPLOWO2_02_FULL_40_19]OFX10748.1 MAG: [acyl-carrier-protein] S-malonyltransferase [Alphaproteobacteria bacterium RIFCSPLOWO2_12_FULL_40_11]
MKTAIVFPGQGSQAVGMGKDLFENFVSAREVFQKVDEILSVNLSKIMFEGPSEELTKTENTQPALMAVSIALITILEKDFGKKFENLCAFTAGHSLGEYSALCAAKALSLEETAKLLQVRGRAMAKCGEKTTGAMAAILGVEIQVAEEIASEAAQNEICQIANDNSVGQVVISGSKSAINRAVEIAKKKGAKRAIVLPVSGAFHSALMLDAQNEMKIALAKAEIKSPSIPVIANVTADIANDPNQIRDLLAKQITAAVRWRETMIFLASQGVEEIIEIGSGKVLSGLVARTCPNLKSRSIQNFEDVKLFNQ